jgi:hypothetical protein
LAEAPKSTDTPQPMAAPALPTSTPVPTDTPVPPSPPPAAIGKVGERVEQAGVAITVLSTSSTDKINDFLKPEEGNNYLVLDVIVENVSRDESTPYNPMYFKLKDNDGFEYTPAGLAPEPSLKSGELKKGDKARGQVAFEVKAAGLGFVVSYEPLVLFGGYEPIRVDLSQKAESSTQAQAATPVQQQAITLKTVGERVEETGIAMTVVSVSKANKIGDFLTPTEGNVFLVIEVIIENVSRDEKTPYNPFYFKVKDSQGFEYNVAMLAPDPSLKSGDLAKGEKVRGNVAFEVNAAASGLISSYEPLVILGGYEPIQVNLGQ